MDIKTPPHVRPAQPSDSDEWLRLRLALWPDAERSQLAGEIAAFLEGTPEPLDDLYAAFVCARPDGRLCGLIEVSIRQSAPGCATDRIGFLEGWYVDAEQRGQGVGRALVQAAEAWALAQGCSEMASDTDPSYPLSPAAHAALGYAEVVRFFRKDLQPRTSV